ncbi:unnamed protein product [Auanema sp. JU1783]|nr:unnamed protein product [Auanema sp. JU1783]
MLLWLTTISSLIVATTVEAQLCKSTTNDALTEASTILFDWGTTGLTDETSTPFDSTTTALDSTTHLTTFDTTTSIETTTDPPTTTKQVHLLPSKLQLRIQVR